MTKLRNPNGGLGRFRNLQTDQAVQFPGSKGADEKKTLSSCFNEEMQDLQTMSSVSNCVCLLACT